MTRHERSAVWEAAADRRITFFFLPAYQDSVNYFEPFAVPEPAWGLVAYDQGQLTGRGGAGNASLGVATA